MWLAVQSAAKVLSSDRPQETVDIHRLENLESVAHERGAPTGKHLLPNHSVDNTRFLGSTRISQWPMVSARSGNSDKKQGILRRHRR